MPTIIDKLKKKFRYRSSATGRFIKRAFALLHPDTTEKEETK